MTDSNIKNEMVRKLQTRVEHLENLTRWHLFALDLLASLGEFHSGQRQDRNPGRVFQIARKQVKRLLNFKSLAFFLVREEDASFELVDGEPDDLMPQLKREVDALIESGMFSYAISQNRALSVKSEHMGDMLILHVLATQARVRGMFVGSIQKTDEIYNEMMLYTLSIMMQATANSLESVALYNLMHDNNKILEEKVLLRTNELEIKNRVLESEITNRKKMEASLMLATEQAEEAYQAKSEYVSRVSYEIRTQVNSILGHSAIMREDIKQGSQEKTLEDLVRIEEASRALLGMVDDILSS